MRNVTSSFLLCAVAACSRPESRPPQPAPPPGVSAPEPEPEPEPEPTPAPVEPDKLLVMPLKPETGLESSARALDEMMLEAIHDLNKYEVLGPEDLNAVLGVEAMRDAMGCDDVACAAELGGALGAPYLVAGQLTRLGEQAVLSLRLMDTQMAVVLERSTARGSDHAEALATMLAVAVGDLFHVEVATSEATRVAAPKQPGILQPGPNTTDYTHLMTELGRLTSNNEYTQMLARLDAAERETINTPPNVDLREILVYYRVLACSMLKRKTCVRRIAQVYQKMWPRGVYKNAVESFVEQLDDEALHRDAKTQDVDAKIEELRAAVRAGRMEPLVAKEMGANVLLGGRRYREAAAAFTELIQAHRSRPNKAMELVGSLVMALEGAGDLAKARQVLERARQRNPRLFRLHGLHHKLRMLPR